MSDDLCRSVTFDLIRATDDAGDGLTLEGYAAVFGQPTRIDSWEGSFNESIRKGAFRKTIRENTPVMQFDHGRHPLIGSIPIGRIAELREDEQGLYVKARLTDNWLIEPVRDAIRDEAVDGMSFRFGVVREEWRDKYGKLVKPEELNQLLWEPGERGPLERTLVEVKVRELGPVVWPAYDGTSVGVRARGVASAIATDDELRREVRAALAGALDQSAGDLPADPDLRREVARAVLFPQTPAAPLDEHPADPEPERSDPETPDAPPPAGHPSVPDAPPAAGHPSPPPNTKDGRAAYARKAYVLREGVGRKYQ